MPLRVAAGAEVPVTVQIALPEPGDRGTVTIRQERRGGGPAALMGGITFVVGPAEDDPGTTG